MADLLVGVEKAQAPERTLFHFTCRMFDPLEYSSKYLTTMHTADN